MKLRWRQWHFVCWTLHEKGEPKTIYAERFYRSVVHTPTSIRSVYFQSNTELYPSWHSREPTHISTHIWLWPGIEPGSPWWEASALLRDRPTMPPIHYILTFTIDFTVSNFCISPQHVVVMTCTLEYICHSKLGAGTIVRDRREVLRWPLEMVVWGKAPGLWCQTG